MLYTDMRCLFTQRMHPSMPIEPYMSAHEGGGVLKEQQCTNRLGLYTQTYIGGLNMPRLKYNIIVGFKVFYLNYLY